jgi:hypothetical protein
MIVIEGEYGWWMALKDEGHADRRNIIIIGLLC